MVSKSVIERVAGRKVNGFGLEMTPSGRFGHLVFFLDFLFSVPIGFLSGLGGFWGLN